MIKRENLTTGTRLANASGEKAFIGSRVEGKQRVTSVIVEVPYEDAITGEVFYVKEYRKTSVPVNALPADYSVAHEKCNSYMEQEFPAAAGGVTARANFAAGAIDWTIEDIA